MTWPTHGTVRLVQPTQFLLSSVSVHKFESYSEISHSKLINLQFKSTCIMVCSRPIKNGLHRDVYVLIYRSLCLPQWRRV